MDDEERLEGEEEMELDEASDGEDDDEEAIGIPVSPATSDQLFTSVPVTPGNVTPEEPFDPLRYQKFPLPGGKPLSIRRGPGRPRKERPPGTSARGLGPRRPFGRGSTRGKALGYARGGIRRTKSKDDDTHSESQSPLRLGDDPNGEGESSGIDRSMPAPEEPPYLPEKWPGKVCALCNLGERSQLGQGELLQLTYPVGFVPEKNANREETADLLMDMSSTGDKSPRGVGPGAVTCRRQKSLAKCRNPSLTNYTEPVEELTIVGYSEEPDVGLLFEANGIYYVHKSCAIWSSCCKDIITESISPAIVHASSRRCAYCSHYGAAISCKVGSCNRYFHFPCAAASSCFQDTKTLSLFCKQHLGQVPLLLNDIACIQCYGMGDVSNLVMCTVCGQHYHGSCVGLALHPGVRAGWQCAPCRVCQVCRQPEEVSKVMLCEQCDKAYHPSCLRPIVTSIPKYGWKCKCCRVCTDCGSRTPGAGQSSRWHSHFTVCDSCYQQRNKGFFCPICGRAYRAAALREMVKCTSCKKYVHGTCDAEADPLTYQHRKEAKPDYEYVCTHCKSQALIKRKDNIDEYCGDSSLTASQESLYGDGDSSEFDCSVDDPLYIGLGKGKPSCASKIAKKRLGLAGIVGRPKGVGKLGYQKRQKLNEFGRKRGPKAKMRGIFGVPGVGLQKPQSDSSKEEEPGVENRLVLCSAKDKFVLTQDICVMCGAIGTDSEGCLIACAQCGQCYHPYCANVKVTKIILQKGWRCLDCTVCEGCGERHDEGRLILCDDCDISYHIYCMDPPLDYVPHGTWKCKWCALCQTCGSNDPGFNSSWQKNYTQCGPCASHSACASCQEPYNEGDLIIQCVQCERWLHCGCDHIKTEADAEKCAEEGYNCVLCRPRDVPPPHILSNLPKPILNKYPRSPPPIVRSPELYKPSTQQYLVDGVYLSEAGMHHIKSLTFEQQQTRKKRRKMLPVIDKDADIMATIESVVAGSSLDNSLEENGKHIGMDIDVKNEPDEVLKEGMVWTHGDQPPPEGYSLYTTENGISVLRRKRQRNLQKLGIGGFVVRLRGTRKDKEHEGEPDKPLEGTAMTLGDDKPRKKGQRKKQQPKLAESFPLYMQEAFFGKDLMDVTKDRDLKSSSDSDSERNISGSGDTIQLSQDELKAIEQVKKNAKEDEEGTKIPNDALVKREEIIDDETSDTEALGDILPISTDLLDTDELVNTIMNEPDGDLAVKASEALDELDDQPGQSRDELTDILSPHFNLESMVRDTGLPNMDSKDVEEIFKGVLTDESQESQESSVFPIQAQTPRTPSTTTPLVSPSPHPNMQTPIPLGRPQVPGSLPPVAQSNLNSPMSFPPPSPYHSEYSNSPQFSPAFSEPPSPWINPDEEGSGGPVVAATGKQGNNAKMFQDEKLGAEATISSVLYANMNHPEWKEEYPSWPERCKQILKKWRALPNETKAPYLTQARDNRATVRMKKTQQIPKDIPSTIQVTATSSPTIMTKPVTSITSSQVTPLVGMGTSQKQIGLLASVASDKSTEKPSIQGQVQTVISGLSSVIGGVATGSQNIAEEQDRLSNRDRTTREAEQERQWKQLQAFRQQQAQLQQQVIHEQRVHAMTRGHRAINDDGSQMTPDTNSGLTTQLQVSTSQDGTQLGPMTSPSPGSRGTFATPPLKVNRLAAPQSPLQSHPRLPNQPCATMTRPVGTVVRPGMANTFAQPPSPFSPQAPQSPHDFPQSPASSQTQEHFQRFDNPEGFNQGNQTPRPIIPGTPTYATSPRNDVFSQPPGTPRPIFNPPTPRTSTHVYAPSRTPDPYSNQPQTPSPAPSYTSPRPESRQESPAPEVFSQQPEVNRQLRDLLQRQQFSKKIEQNPGNWSQEVQSPVADGVQQQFEQGHVQISQHVQPAPNNVEGTFRHPLPPGMRPRMPLQLNVFIRNSQGNVDARLQGIDPRTRMLVQRPQIPGLPQQHFQNQQLQNPQQILQQRMPAPRNPMAEQYEMLQQSPQVPQPQPQLQTQQQPPRFPDSNQTMQRIVRAGQDTSQSVRMMSQQSMARPPLIPSAVNDNQSTSEASEIPDNVTAELEKLEQEGAPMVEVEGVSAILGDLAEDDDELLAEMGADFNILEYADPELDNITGGEKTNILDMDLEQVEVETKEEKLKKESKVEEHKTEELGATGAHEMGDNATVSGAVEASSVSSTPVVPVPQIPTSQTQPPQAPGPPMLPQNHPQVVAVQQQMNHHLQQAAAMGRPIPPGMRLTSLDGAIVGVVTSTNTVTVSYPSTFPGHGQRLPQQHMQLQQQRLGMRVPGVQGVPGRVVSVSHMVGPRMPLAPPPPPPPPYPGPPPPYPGPVQMGLCQGGRGMPRAPVHIGHQMSAPGPPMAPVVHTGSPTVVPHPHRRPLLLQSCSQEQPLLLEDLLEQEKREQEKQQKQQQVEAAAPGPLLSDVEFERLRADVLGSSALGSPPQTIAGPSTGPIIRPPGKSRPPSTPAPTAQWPQVPPVVNSPIQSPRQPIATQTAAELRIATFNIPHLPAPPAPPDVIATEQDRMIQLQYEQWLVHQGQILKQQQTYYETEMLKLRKVKKSLNSKKRQLIKAGNELTESDAIELKRISDEAAALQKFLEPSRKQFRQHNILAQEYQNKQQQQRQVQPQNSEPCSPLMSPSQHSSPMHSPAGLVSHSPGPGSSGMIQHSPATSMIQHSPNAQMLQHSPGTQQPTNPGTMSPHSMQPSPRIGTPHSQGEESPFSPGAMPSPGMCGPTTRMASPQHRAVMSSRLATSPGGFQDRGNQQIMNEQSVRLQNIHQRFVRPPNIGEMGQRPRMQMQGGIIYNQRSPLGSPQPSQQQHQPMMTQQQHQQLVQRQMQQQQQQQHENTMNQEQNMINQRNMMAQQRQMMSQNQQQQQHVMQKPPSSPMVSQPANSPSPQLHQQMQQNYGQPPSSPMPRSPMVQQTMGSPMLQQQLSQNSQPPSPMGGRIHHPPTSPMVSQYQPNPPSPMARSHPSTSPMLQHQLNNQHHPPPPPSSPMPRSPMVAGSPMQMQRRQSSGNSPAMPDRPQSVENPGTPRTPHTPHTPHYNQLNSGHVDQQQQQLNQNQMETQSDHQNRGGGNPHNPMNPIPFKRNFGRFGFIKLGLRGGSPMWSTKPESSKGKTEPRISATAVTDEKPNTSAVHRKTGISQSKINSLVCADYNDFDDDSHTPPQTPPNRSDSKVVQGVVAEKSSLGIGSPSDKLEAMPDTTDYDDDKTIVNEEVTLSSTAQRDNDDITVIEEFSESELGDVVLGALDPEMQEEYVLFEQDMVVDLSVDSNDSLSHALVNNTNQSHDLVQILEIQQAHDDQVLSDEELIPTQNRNKKGLRLDIVRTLGSGKRLVAVTDTPESPDQDEIIDQSPGTSPFLHSSDHNFIELVEESEVVIIDPSTKSPDDHLVKEDCVEEAEKIDCNFVDINQKGNDTIESSTPDGTDKKSPSFNFCEKSPMSSMNVDPAGSSDDVKVVSLNEIVIMSATTDIPEENEVKIGDCQKSSVLPSKVPNVIADTKIYVKSSQSSQETALLKLQKVNSVDIPDGPVDAPKIEDKIIELKPEINLSKPVYQGRIETETIKNSVPVKSPAVSLKPKSSTLELSPKENEISSQKVSAAPEKISTITKSAEKPEESTSKAEPTPTLTNCTPSSSEVLEESLDEKKTDPLNTTDELEDMLEKIHNPAENAINGESKKEKSVVSPLQRISPVVDEMSLVNILESDTDPIINEKSEDKREDKLDSKIIKSESLTPSEIKTELESSSKAFEDSVQQPEEPSESPEDILDMLDNIISTKPEMVDTDILEEDRSRKSSLIYQMPTPLESLPLNILQDSLMDLETPGENETPAENPPQVQIPSKPVTEIRPATKSPPSSQPPTAVIVSTVAQLQRSTTTIPHLSPLSKPTELTSNVANVSHQLRTLLSSLQTNHSQSYTTAGQATLVSMVSSGAAAAKASIVVTATGTNALSSSSATLNFTKSSDTTSTFSSGLKEPPSVVPILNKTSSSEQFNRISSSVGGVLASLPSPTIASRPGTNSGISITSNAMLNAMLSRTTSLTKPTIAGHRANTITSNLLSSVLPTPTIQKSQNMQAILQVSSGGAIPSKAPLNTSAVSTSVQSAKTVVPPMIANTINVTTSILQSTLSQAPTLLHSQLSGQSQYKTGLLPIDNKSGEIDSPVGTSKDEEKTLAASVRADDAKAINAHRMEESQNVLLKQLLQNTACATTAPPSSTSSAPSLPIVPSLEAQLARPTPTPPSSLIPPLLNKIPSTKTVTKVLTRETSFVSHIPIVKSQSPPTKEDPPKPSTPVSSGSVPPLQVVQPVQTIQRSIESVPKVQSKVPSPVVTQPIVTVANKPIPQKIESPPQSEVPTPVSTPPVPPKTPTSESMAPAQQIRVTNVPTTFTRLVPTSKPVQPPPAQKIMPQNPQLSNHIQTPPQPSTPVSITPPQTPQPQPQLQGLQQKPQIQMQHQLPQQLQTPRPQVVNTLQPSVPQTMPMKIGHQAHLQQGAIAQHTVPLVEVKKEILDEVLSGSTPGHNSDTKDFLTAKEEIMDGTIDDKNDLKKLKRRQYQQKRRQSQGKDASAQPQKKRSRKVSRLDEDYDTFIDNLMVQLRQLPQMTVLEPLLGRNYGVCPIFGSGDLSKIGNQRDYNTRTGDCSGVYGVARLLGVSDHYNTHPFGEQEPSTPQQPASTQRGFYDQEFPPLKLDDALDKKENLLMTRDVDTPDTIVSSSSPECVIPEFVNRFPGLRLIEEESDEESDWLKRVSPVIPLVSPIPIRLKPAHIKDNSKQDKENLGTRLGKSSPVALRENGNVTVTLTLNSQAADDIMGVLKDLANILNISPPNGYQIVERTTTPPSQRLGLYRTKGKDGKEGAPIDFQSILNGAAKFCRHCDVVIFHSLIRTKVSDLPFLTKEEAESGDELCFCSAACYYQFARMHRTPTTPGKAATIVDHLCSISEVKLLNNTLKKKIEKRSLEKQQLGLETLDVDQIEINTDIKIKTEKDDSETMMMGEELMQLEERRPRKHPASEDLSVDLADPQPPAKLWRGLKYKLWTMGGIQPATKYKKPTDREITEMLFRMGVTVSPVKNDDSRRCMFCQNQGDGAADGPARLLNFDVDKWVHLNCALWSEDVYETVNGALMNLDIALQHSLVLNCVVCEKPGATVKCFKIRCTNVYHLGCAVKDGCVFYKNKSTFCSQHAQKNDKDNELTTLSVYRRVYVNRDENRQVAAVMHHSDHNHLLRVGSLIFLSVGQLLPHQLANFHTVNYIYPVGYKIVRFYWSMRRPNKRCRYVCSIHDVSGRPEFRVLVQEPAQEDVELRDASPRAVWSRILQPLADMRKSTNSVQLFPRYVSGEDLFGLTEPAIVRVLESLPGIETLTDYRPKYGRNPLLELPLAINPTGSARTEGRLRNQLPWKRPHTQRTGSSARATYAPAAAVAGEVACPYSKQFVHSKSSQYKKMKQDWRNNVYLARSKIQGLGLYAARDLEKHQMVIEYIGEIIRTELAETREKQYEARNRGIYMFRLDEERVVDATLCGGLARYINHSCNPNCVAEIVEVERDLRIIIFAKRRISRGEELAYDYKFDIEDDQHKIACACGAPNCRKWMN
ncbi:histone-lysine N-methyltransferase 2C isoform X3 [Fopius arisanus]|uniref:Histone-lysine N-methyltransferase 2C isoform X3 n=1 Tax=Fopius arisanus TaxID=64838 RepID=A0A9R1U029_9HYME|nr:PREDICTED: histone-lysine N-methyltransferase 2C-like isoform X3 [Fopius arisanus]